MISQGKERRYWGADAQGMRGDALTVQDQFQLRRISASVGGRTNSSRCSTLPVNWPGIRCHGPGHFYTNRSGSLAPILLRRDALRRARRLGLTHAGPGRHPLCRVPQGRDLQTPRIQPCLPQPVGRCAHIETSFLEPGSNVTEHSLRSVGSAQEVVGVFQHVDR